MKNTNKYGFYSGGYIFDRIDRYALRMLNNSYPETKNEPWFTEFCEVNFLRQMCDTSATFLRTTTFQKFDDSATIGAELVQGKTVLAIGYVGFKRAKKDYCKLKQKKRQKNDNRNNTKYN